jgi:hypothetical protein
MDGLQRKRARKLVEQLSESCGLLVVHGAVVMRCPGAPYTDTPMMMFDETDVQNALALDLLEKRKVTGSFQWEWYMAKRKPPKPGDWIVFSDGSRRKIDGVEQGIAFYGKGDRDLVPCENLVPASNAGPDCWEIDNTL